ncbi:MAG: LytR cpsA psr protein [Patescibacteria group bacterium]|nr:LytR cpsA psr protein [Patescibacteria group bacterium]
MPKTRSNKPLYAKRTLANSRSSSRGVVQKRAYGSKKVVKTVKKHLWRTALGMLLVIASVAVMVSVGLYKFINAPFTKASEDEYFANSVWDTENFTTNIAIVYVSDYSEHGEVKRLFLFKADDKAGKYYTYDFPTEEEITIPIKDNEKNTLKLKDIYSKSFSDKTHFTSDLKDFFVNYLAVKIDGYIIIDEATYTEINDIYGGIDFNDLAVNLRLKNSVKVPRSLLTFRDGVKTNLSVDDTFSVLKFIKNTSSNSSIYHRLSTYELLDNEQWDRLWQESTQYAEVKKEGIKVFVLNASNDPKIPGLAGWGNRLAKNIGSNVLGAENSFTDFEENTIIVDDENLNTVRLLADTLQITNVVKLSDLIVNGGYNSEIFRTKATLVLVDY